jgi:hypothetical protein
MDQKQEPIKPMTPGQREAEASFAKEIYLELSNPSPDTRRKMSEAIKLRRKSAAASLIANPTKPK